MILKRIKYVVASILMIPFFILGYVFLLMCFFISPILFLFTDKSKYYCYNVFPFIILEYLEDKQEKILI